MTKERWTKVQALFELALERAPADQTAFLREACGDDTTLYREVLSLLNVEIHSLLDEGALNAYHLATSSTDDLPITPNLRAVLVALYEARGRTGDAEPDR